MKKKKDSEKRKIEDAEMLQKAKMISTSKDGKVQLNFNERVLPKTLYIHIATGQIKFGDDLKPLSDCPVIFTFEDNVESATNLLTLVRSLGEVSKVIMDNTKDFKVLALEEFIALFEKQIVHFNAQKPN